MSFRYNRITYRGRGLLFRQAPFLFDFRREKNIQKKVSLCFRSETAYLLYYGHKVEGSTLAKQAKARMNQMKNTKRIDEEKMTITLNRDFLKKAGQFGTAEFFEALEMKKEGYTLVERRIKKNPAKRTYADLTYDKMKSVIEGCWTDSEERNEKLEEFNYIKRWAKTQPGSYAKVKNWFKENYGSRYEEVEAKATTEKEMRKSC